MFQAMQANEAIGRNLAALQRIVAALVALLAGRNVLPRHVHVAMRRLLRPAEAAARRLIIAAAQGLVVQLPQRRSAATRALAGAAARAAMLRAISRHSLAKAGRTSACCVAPKQLRPMRLSLLDPLRRIGRRRSRTVPPHAAPRICVIGVTRLFRLPPPPAPQDPLDASRLALRLAALGAALEDVSGEALRFARWRARARQRIEAQRQQREAEAERASQNSLNDQPGAALARQMTGINRTGARIRPPAPPPPRLRRSWPLRSGRPPGGRPMGLDPASARGRKIREIDEILAEAHALAMQALGKR